MSERIAEIRERLEKATPGPWVNEGDVVADEQSIVVGVESYNWRFVAHINSDTDDGPETPPISPEEAKANAEFIANAPTDIAFLLDELAAAKAEVKGRFAWDSDAKIIRSNDLMDALLELSEDLRGQSMSVSEFMQRLYWRLHAIPETTVVGLRITDESPLLKPGEKGK